MFPFESLFNLDKNSRKPLYQQIAFSLSQAIQNGILKPGSTLPSSRELSKTLQLHRKTIVAAYEELHSQDWIAIVPRKKTIVSERIPLLPPKSWQAEKSLLPYENAMNADFKNAATPQLRPAITRAEIIIDDGRPDIRISPIDLLLKTYRSLLLQRYARKNIEQNMAQGTLVLRLELVNYLAVSRGLNLTIDNLLITHGAQMSIYLSSQLLLDSQSTIVVGTPNYPMANTVFRQSGAQLIELTVDQWGIDTDQLEVLCQTQRITAVYVIPHHHYPTTVTLSTERRMHLLNLSKRYTFVIIEDDYDYDFHYSSSPYLPLASAQHLGNIIYIGSFSKILDPSLRIGFMIAPKNFITQAVAFRKMIDIGGDGYMQDALAVLIADSELKRHVKKAKKTYQLRREYLTHLLNTELYPYISFDNPSGGMAMWIILHREISVHSLQKKASEFHLQINEINKTHNAFRFGFASLNERELDTTVAILKKCCLQLNTK
ncbi:PLP-dependent aminotransferase family protein [Flavobacterium sp. NKUCC04_CG]|uniref:MocR-like pyridoxine biosynthesis transcription factor PdxR n=1 Tax=Flavobacterium sp. NKUCC04_CG TaxID=2842121 RepID=UPI001C5AE0BE|nr:PLP-dependent aminotransferase family protein [Flavobacterium sp. NKUCC04_CG]MBW3520426.1 PLP-dependent aminotransferase family protein [Flavobacterium sp. NKUCC04_CG]